jgi:putative ATP-dependent endonuclease of the OLD family
MRLSKLSIRNFRNFQSIDVPLSDNAVLLGRTESEKAISYSRFSSSWIQPYVNLAAALKLPYCVITDWDPLDGSKPPLGRKLKSRKQWNIPRVRILSGVREEYARCLSGAMACNISMNEDPGATL